MSNFQLFEPNLLLGRTFVSANLLLGAYCRYEIHSLGQPLASQGCLPMVCPCVMGNCQHLVGQSVDAAAVLSTKREAQCSTPIHPPRSVNGALRRYSAATWWSSLYINKNGEK